jgi:hypothetical protein
MKNKLNVLLCIMALSALPLRAGEDLKPATVEQRLREVDLSLMLQQYERLQMNLFEARLQLDLLDTVSDLSDTARKKQSDLLQKKCDILVQHVDETRLRLHQLAALRGEETAVAKAK